MVRSRDMATAAKMTAAVVGVLALAVGLWYARTAILLAFAGILLAIVLFDASRALAELTKLPRLLMLAAMVVGLYALIQFLESYLLTPLIQARAVSMPPAVVILSQLVLGAIFGLLGLALATRLVAATTVPLRFLFGIGGKDKPSAS